MNPTDILFGVPVPALVLLIVELLKRTGIVKDGDTSRVANLVVSALCAVALIYVAHIPAGYLQVITLGFTALYNIVMAAIGFNQLIKKPAEKARLAQAAQGFGQGQG